MARDTAVGRLAYRGHSSLWDSSSSGETEVPLSWLYCGVFGGGPSGLAVRTVRRSSNAHVWYKRCLGGLSRQTPVGHAFPVRRALGESRPQVTKERAP